jgi:serine protease AprX
MLEVEVINDPAVAVGWMTSLGAQIKQHIINTIGFSFYINGLYRYNDSVVDRAAERAVRAGLVVVVAAGNSGCGDNPRPIPPANSPSVITVGGYDDNNQLENRELDLYCSNFGYTVDGLLKPEIIAPAIRVAAPILPGPDFYRRAEALSQLAAAPDYALKKLARSLAGTAGLPASIAEAGAEEIRAAAESLLRESKVVAAH